MSGIAEELRRRSSKDYVKERAKEVVVKSGTRMKDRMVGSPMAWTILGGFAGAGIGSVAARWYLAQQDRKRLAIEFEPERQLEYPGRAEELQAEAQAKYGELREKASDKVDELKGKAVDLKETAKEKFVGAKDTVVGKAQEFKERLPELQERGKSTVQRGINEAPWSIVVASLVAGVAISLLIPVTNPERRVFKQYKAKASDKLLGVKEQAAQKLEDLAQKADERISHMAEQEMRPNTPGSTFPH